MQLKSFILRGTILGLSLFGVQACNRNSPEPATSQAVSQPSQDQITTAKNWFTQASATNPIGINWQQASVIDGWVVAPLAIKTNPFGSKKKYGYRYAIVHVPTSGALTGRIVELVSDGKELTGEDAVKTALTAAKPIFLSNPLSHLDTFSGWVMSYSPTYSYDTGLIYEKGDLKTERVHIEHSASSGITGKGQVGATHKVNECFTVATCGYVNGYLSNCIYDTYCGGGGSDTGTGAGNDGTGGWGGGGDGGGSGPGTGDPIADNGPLTTGDHSKLIKYQYDALTQIVVLIEWTGTNHTVDKLSLTTVGVTYGTTFLPVGNGIVTYRDDLDVFRYSAYCQFQAGTSNTGPIANGSIFRVYGTLNATTGEYTIRMDKQ